MALKISDRVKETTVTTGTGTITLGGAVSGFRTFASVLSNNDTTYYAIVGSSEFEVGLGTFSGSTLTRDTVLSSSNSGNKVDFAAGTKNIFITQPADKAVYKDENDTIDINTDNVTEGSTNLYFTNERVDDRVGSLLVAGDNVTLSYDDAAGTLTISATEDNLYNNDTDDLAEGSTNLYYTDTRFDTRLATKDTDDVSEGATNLYHTTERVQDVVGGQFITNGTHTGISFSYDDFTDGAIDATVSLSSFSTSDLSEGTNLYYTTARFDSTFSGKSTSDLSEGTNLYYTDTRFDTRLATKTTDNLTEGSNLYYTDERVDDRVANLIQNGTGISFAYNDSLGTLTPTVSLSAFDTDNLSEGSSNLYYTDTRANAAIDARVTQSFVNALNVQAASVQANSVALGTDTTGNYVATIAGTANKVSVTGSGSESAAVTLSLPDDVQIASNLTVGGNLTVNGTTTQLDTTNLAVSDNLFELNSGLTGTPVNDSGMLIQRGTSDNAVFMWDESIDKFTLGTTTATGTATGNITVTTGSLVANLEGNVTGNVTGTVSSLSNHDTGDLAEGSNLYHTTERVQDIVGGQLVTNGTHTGVSFAYDDAGDGAIDATVSLSSFSTSDLSEGTNLYYTDGRFDTRLAAKSTSDLSEGTNLYYTTARFDSAFSGKSTSDLSEGTNLYYTDARVESYLDGGTSTPTFASATVSGDLTVDTDTLHVDSTNNRVGINTTSPDDELHIRSTAQAGAGLRLENSNTSTDANTVYGTINFEGNDASAGASGIRGSIVGGSDGTSGAMSLEFSTASAGGSNTERMRINATGVGIGLGGASPSTPLHVKTDGSGYALTIEENSGGEAYQIGTDSFGGLVFFNSGTKVADFADSSEFQVYASGAVKAKISPTGNSYFDGGNVGIGTTSPNSLLDIEADPPVLTLTNSRDGSWTSDDLIGHIKFFSKDASGIGSHEVGFIKSVVETGSTAFGAALTFGVAPYNTAASEAMRIDEDGNVGIGTDSPFSPLTVKTDTDHSVNIRTKSDGTGARIVGLNLSGSSYDELALDGDELLFHISGTERMKLNSFGRLGVGTAGGNAGITCSTDIRAAGPSFANDANTITMSQESGGSFITARGPDTSTRGTLSLSVNRSNGAAGIAAINIDNSGKVGIGTSSPAFNLTTQGSSGTVTVASKNTGGNASVYIEASDTNTAKLELAEAGTGSYSLQVGNDNALMFFDDSSERMRIDSSGDILFGVTSDPSSSNAGAAFTAETGSRMLLKLATTATNLDTLAIFINGNGEVGNIRTTGSSTQFNTSSDYRLKENVVYDWTALDRLNQLKPARFNFIADADKTVDGFLAHEVASVVPEAISGEKDAVDDEDNPIYQGIDQSKLVPLLVKAVQELTDKVEALEAQLQGN